MNHLVALTPMQEMMLAAAVAGGEKYVTAAHYRIKRIPFEVLRTRFERLTSRHEILRTTITVAGGKPYMRVAEAPCAAIMETAALPAGPFSIDPLHDDILVKLFVCTDEILLVFSHILLDGWSVTLLLRELLAETPPQGAAPPFRYYIKRCVKNAPPPERFMQEAQAMLPFQTETSDYHRGEMAFTLANVSHIKDTARALSVSVGRFIEGVWGVLCARYADGDTWIAAVDSGRLAPVPGIAKIAGMMVSTLPLEVKLTEDRRFRDYIQGFSEGAAQKIRDGYAPPSGKLRSMISVEFSDFSGGENFTLLHANARLITDFDVVVSLGDKITCRFEYNTFAFSDNAVRAIRGHFENLIAAFAANPDALLCEVDFLSDREKALLFRDNSDPALDAASNTPIIRQFEAIAARYPEKTAITDSLSCLSYAQVDRLSGNIARYLVSRSIGGGVMIRLPRSADFVVAELGVMKAGCYFIPVDPTTPGDRYEELVRAASPSFIITSENYAALTDSDVCATLPEITPAMPAYAITTSGTTGKPKGVLVAHKSIAHYLAWAARTYQTDTQTATALIYGFTFDGAFGSIYHPLLAGGTLHILSDATRFDIPKIAAYCRAHNVTHLDLPAALLPDFTQFLAAQRDRGSLRYLITGGEQVKSFRDCGIPVSNEYGPTECTVCVTQGFLTPGAGIHIGRELPNSKIYVLDSRGKPCPPGICGECHVAGVQVAMGYSGDTASGAFIENPFGEGRMYKTGDRMRFVHGDDGFVLQFEGRTDSQIKLNGYRIELGEIEMAARVYGGIENAAATLRGTYIALYAVCADADALQATLHAHLPPYMVPVVIPVPKIPLSENGKPDFGRLASYESQRTVAPAEAMSPDGQLLCDLMFELGGIRAAGTDNFTAVGGNSITAMQLSFALSERGITLTPAEIITSTSIDALSQNMRLSRENYGARDAFAPPDALKSMVYLAEKHGHGVYTVSATAPCRASRTEVAENIQKAAGLHDILRCRFSLDAQKNMTAAITETPNIKLLCDNEPLPNTIDPLGETLIFVALEGETLTLRYHHIALDGYSVKLLLAELTEGQFPETAHSYAAFVNGFGDREADHAFYMATLEGCEAVSLFESRNAPETMRTARYFDADFYEKIVAAAQRVPVTPAVFVMAAFGAFLSLYGDSDKTYIPVVAAYRGTGGLMGCAAQTFPVPFCAGGASFGAAATRLRDDLAATTGHISIPEQFLVLPYIFVDDDRTAELTETQNYGLVVTSHGVILYDERSVGDTLLEMLKTRLHAALENALSDTLSLYQHGEYERLTQEFAGGKAASRTYAYPGRFLPAGAGHIADALRALGIGAGDLVAVEARRDDTALSAYAGVSLAGAAFLPLDTALPDARQAAILADCRPAARITNGEITCCAPSRKLPDDTAYVIYTSGTTGQPKGVPIAKNALQSQISWTLETFDISDKDTLLHYMNFSFDPSVWVLFSGFASGAHIEIVPENVRLSPTLVARFIEEKHITIVVLPAAAAYDILQSLRENSLRLIFLGGDTIHIPARTRFTEKIDIVNLYGPTETCINASFYTLPPQLTRTANIGRPVAGTALYILDKQGRLAPIGIRGELYIGGDKLSSGYLHRPKETAHAFLTHPAFGSIYKTGDIALWNADGTVTFIGREDRQVKIRGFRTELSEIEAAITSITGAAAAVTYEGGILAGFVAGDVSEGEVRARLRERLPAFMVPNVLINTPRLPLNANGKIDYQALLVPQTETDQTPTSETETIIAAAFEEVLALTPGTVGRNSDFFALGGHSLKLFALCGALAAHGIPIGINDILDDPVVSDLAALADKLSGAGAPKKGGGAFDEQVYAQYVRGCETVDLSRSRRADTVLITGATGFLGAHLLRTCLRETAARIFLPVRGDVSRIHAVLSYYFPGEAFDISRLVLLAHDISEEPPPVGDAIDIIYHAAADIRHYAPFEESFRANVTATAHMVRFAKEHGAYLAHISTASCVNSPVVSEDIRDLGADFENVYQRTKQIAERRILAENDLRYGIFRVGNITPSLAYRVPALTAETNAYLRLLKLLIQSRILPDFRGRSGYCFADRTATAIRLIAEREIPEKSVFHITNPHILTFRQIFDILGISPEAKNGNIPDELRGIFAQRAIEKQTDTSAEIRSDGTLALLRRLGFTWPSPNLDYIRGFTDYE
jgi:amino acid adenylation domain-containing protein